MNANTKKAVHTSGPWTLTDMGNSKRGNSLDATLNGPNGLPLMFVPFTSENQKANARLIAAAPELLEAVKAMRAACDEWAAEFTQNNWIFSRAMDWGIVNDAYSKAARSIAKAEGEGQ